jgi:hypothetical protein
VTSTSCARLVGGSWRLRDGARARTEPLGDGPDVRRSRPFVGHTRVESTK